MTEFIIFAAKLLATFLLSAALLATALLVIFLIRASILHLYHAVRKRSKRKKEKTVDGISNLAAPMQIFGHAWTSLSKSKADPEIKDLIASVIHNAETGFRAFDDQINRLENRFNHQLKDVGKPHFLRYPPKDASNEE